MFFQVSPGVRKKPPPPKKVHDEESPVEVVSLAPFTPSPKLEFNNILAGTAATRKLLVKNPTGFDIDLRIEKHMPTEMDVILSWSESKLQKGTNRLLEVTWRPVKEEVCRHKLVFCHGQQMNKNIFLIFRSVELKLVKTNGTVKKNNLKPVSCQLTRKKISPTKKLSSPRSSSKSRSKGDKENISPHSTQPFPYSVTKVSNTFVEENVWMFQAERSVVHGLPSCEAAIARPRRGTFTVCPPLMPSLNIMSKQTISPRNSFTEQNLSEAKQIFWDSLEFGSPLVRKEATTVSTPSLEELLKGANANYKRRPDTEGSASPFVPVITSSIRKPASTDNSLENAINCAVPCVERNVSTETYVVNNSSSDNFLRANTSGATYVKDQSVERLNVSPCAPEKYLSPNDVTFKRLDCLAPVFGANLTAIREESNLNTAGARSFQSGGKRKSTITGDLPSKKERLQAAFSPAFRTSKRTSGLNLKQFHGSSGESRNGITYITETTTQTVIVKNPFLFANVIDPFMTAPTSSNEAWLKQQEIHFEKWLNTLLTPPKELHAQSEIDVAKVWQACTTQSVPLAPSKEEVSVIYHTSKKLHNLRRQAQSLYRSQEMRDVLQKVCVVVESGKLAIRSDIDIHLNLKLKSIVIQLMLGYNPLWLRIGLETIYNEVIPLRSNSDSQGLAKFLLERFLKDPQLLKRYKSLYAPNYASEVKKLILKRFLKMVYFLDRAKSNKLIQHDPCLFCKNAVEKESKQMLIHFARETLAAVGDITKYLRLLGYVVNHSQSYIHEFEYGVQNLGVDLRDGVRLAKVMEIIQMRNDLTPKLRVPAISRLQKVHNMQLVFTSLKETGYEIMCDISPKDIVDGNLNKTLSFLWQIIYKFEAPLMVKSATTIQRWFRSLPVQLKRREMQRLHECRESAAGTIQSWYRRQKKIQLYCALSEFLRKLFHDRKQLRAAIKLQTFFRMLVCRRQFARLKWAVLIAQRRFRAQLIMKNCRREYATIRVATIKVQSLYRMYRARTQFTRLKSACVIIQRRYRANISMRAQNQNYLALREAALFVQRRFRANLLMQNCEREYATLRVATIKIQGLYRMNRARAQFTRLKSACVIIQRRYRANISMRAQNNFYLALRNAALIAQRRFRANLLRNAAQTRFLLYRRSAIKIQSYYRMSRMRKYFTTLKKSAIFLQRRFTAQKLMKADMEGYRALRVATVKVQQRFRAGIKGRQDRLTYTQLKSAAVKIQQRYRANKLKLKYQRLKSATCKIQIWYRSLLLMRVTRHSYCLLKRNVLLIEERFVALKLMRVTRAQYQNTRNSAMIIQRRYKATVQMRACRTTFLELRRTAVLLQRTIRAKQMMQRCRFQYEELRKAALSIQRRYRSNKEAVLQRNSFIQQKKSAIRIQRWYRSAVETRKCRRHFLALKKAATIIKRRYIATLQMKIAANSYENLRTATILIQRYYRRVLVGRLCRQELLRKRWAAITIQRYYRNYQESQILSYRYQQLRSAAVFVQRTYRAKRKMLQCKCAYDSLRKATVFIQTKFVAQRLMQLQRTAFLRYREATVKIQRRFKANILMKQERAAFIKTKKMVIMLQQKYRANKAMQWQKSNFNALKKYTIVIQRRFTAKKMGEKCRLEYESLRSAATTLQSRFRASRSMLLCLRRYSMLKWAALVIQRRFRAQALMKRERGQYLKLRSAACIIQRRFRAAVLAKTQRTRFLQFKKSVTIIESYYVNYRETKRQRLLYLKLQAGTLCVQTFARGYLARKKSAPHLTKEAIQMRRELKKQNAAATSIQARWRGYYFRRANVSRLASLTKMRWKRMAHPKTVAESKTLAQRCEDAMFCMIKNCSLFQILAALEDLEYIVRHSREMCIKMSNILPEQLYSIIGAAARSLPEMNTLNVATQILITFCKFPQTRPNSFNADYLDSILGIMLHWCDKEAPLFCTLCTLLWLFAHERKWKRVILKIPYIEQKLEKIEKAIIRKQTMVSNSKKINLNSVFNTNKAALILPGRTATWGLDYDKPVTFRTAPFAFKSFLTAIDLL